MLLLLDKTSGQEIAINLDDIWKVVETDYGCVLSVGSKTYSVTDSYSSILENGASALQEFTSGGVTFAINVSYINTVTPFTAGGSTIVLNNGNVVYVDEDVADIVADQPTSGGAGYLVYTALLSQSGTDAPVATVLENTLGGTVVWSYDDVGSYIATLAGVFAANKTWFSANTEYSNNDFSVNCRRDSDNEAFVHVYFPGDDTGTDGWANLSIEIRVYP